jgi:pyruvate-ferredoxin/flavodoxin oxidoreductase
MDSIERKSHKPFIWSVDEDKHLIRLLVSQPVIGLAEERLRNWRMLRFLNGQPVQEMEKHHRD